jgi:hypothetical protein
MAGLDLASQYAIPAYARLSERMTHLEKLRNPRCIPMPRRRAAWMAGSEAGHGEERMSRIKMIDAQ